MSQADLIKQGQILQRKNEITAKIPQAKAALRSLINEATYAQDKHPRDIDTAVLQAHLDALKAAQTDIDRLYAELKELEY